MDPDGMQPNGTGYQTGFPVGGGSTGGAGSAYGPVSQGITIGTSIYNAINAFKLSMKPTIDLNGGLTKVQGNVNHVQENSNINAYIDALGNDLNNAANSFSNFLQHPPRLRRIDERELLLNLAINGSKSLGRIVHTFQHGTDQQKYATAGMLTGEGLQLFGGELGDIGKLEDIEHLGTFELQETHGQTLSKNAFKNLKSDIKANGIKDPIDYVEHNGEKHVVNGHHRLRAAKELGLKTVPTKQVQLPFGSYRTTDDLIWTRH